MDIRMAHDAICKLLHSWASADATVNYSLHFTAVTLYARPFLPTATSSGKVQYPIKDLKETPGFDQELHQHIIDVRNTLVAHRDYGVSHSTMYLKSLGDEEMPVALGANVKVLAGIDERPLAERYERHFCVCRSVVEEILTREMKNLGEEAFRRPAAFNATTNLPVDRARVEISTSDQILPGPSGPANGVEDPGSAAEICGYRYVTLTHQTPLVKSGAVKLHFDGALQDVTFTAPFGPRREN
jgi:hypothetical protein